MREPLLVEPLSGPVDAEVQVPGSKSHTNRAILCAALADGRSHLAGILRADDTDAMLRAVDRLGAHFETAGHDDSVVIDGIAGRLRSSAGVVDVGLSGTSARFLAPVLALAGNGHVLDGRPPLRARPMGDLLAALRGLGASIEDLGQPGHLPVRFSGGPVAGGSVEITGDASSQFLSGLLLVGPLLPAGLRVRLLTPLVSRPYVDLTVATMRAFAADVVVPAEGREEQEPFVVSPGGYRATQVAIEADASAASYFFAAAAICAGRVTVAGIGSSTTQGDMQFVDVLSRMGASVDVQAHQTTVEVPGGLRGVDVDMRDCSDTAQTLAAVAVFCDGPTRVRGIGFIRAKETDRIGNVVTELRRCGIEAHEHDDGFTVVPGTPCSATIETYDDHRMAMSFALLGLRVPGIRIADPDCVAKTYPRFWSDLDQLRPAG